jgi:hypothetical protein
VFFIITALLRFDKVTDFAGNAPLPASSLHFISSGVLSLPIGIAEGGLFRLSGIEALDFLAQSEATLHEITKF